MDSDHGKSPTFRDFVRTMWRRKWIVLAIVVIATASAYFLSARQPARYRASATLIYEPQVNVSDPLSSNTYVDPNTQSIVVQSAGSDVASAATRAQVATQVGADFLRSVEYEVSTEAKTSGSSTYTNMAVITVESSDPQAAARLANAYAAAFISLRRDRERVRVLQAEKVVQARLKSFKSALKSSPDYILLQGRLNDLKILYATLTGDFRVVQAATVPAEPFSPQPLRAALLGLAFGIFAAIVVALVMEQFDTSVRDQDHLASILRLPVLGRIPRFSKRALEKNRLVTVAEPDGHPAEAFRMLRSNLEFVGVDGELSSLLVTSCLQGEGKSATACNLAVSLALAGKRIIVVDGDLRRPRVHSYFGLDNEVGLSSVVAGRVALGDALKPYVVLPEPGRNGSPDGAGAGEGVPAAGMRVGVLTSGPLPPNPGEIVASQRFAAIVAELAREVDLVIVDSPAMLAVGDASALAAKVDGLVLVVDIHMVSRPVMGRAAELLQKLPCKKLGLVVMRQREGAGYYPRYYYYYSEDGARSRKETPAKA